MVNARDKGNTYERKIMNELKELWFKDCKTSRYASKMLDDMKVDLTNTWDYNIQCKSVEALNLRDCIKIIHSMPNDNKINVIFWKKKFKKLQFKEIKQQDFMWEYVIIKKKDFYNIMQKPDI